MFNQETGINYKGKMYFSKLFVKWEYLLRIKTYVNVSSPLLNELQIKDFKYRMLFVDFIIWVLINAVYCSPFDPLTAAVVAQAGIASMDALRNPKDYAMQLNAPPRLEDDHIAWLQNKVIGNSWKKIKNLIPSDKLINTLTFHRYTMGYTDSKHGHRFYYLLLQIDDELDVAGARRWELKITQKAQKQQRAKQQQQAPSEKAYYTPHHLAASYNQNDSNYSSYHSPQFTTNKYNNNNNDISTTSAPAITSAPITTSAPTTTQPKRGGKAGRRGKRGGKIGASHHSKREMDDSDDDDNDNTHNKNTQKVKIKKEDDPDSQFFGSINAYDE